MEPRARVIACITALLALGALSSAQRALDVPDDYPTIQAAIDAASPGDTVFVRAGTYTENLVIGKPLHLVGEDHGSVWIEAQDPEAPVIAVSLATGEVSIRELTVRGGDTGLDLQAGAGARVTVEWVRVVGNTIGVWAMGAGTVSVRDSLLVDNDYGLYTSAGTAELVGLEISRGTVGILLDGAGRTTIQGCLIGLAQYAIETHTTECGWSRGAQAFQGAVVGGGNRVFGVSTDLCPSYPGKPWPKGFVDEAWRKVVGEAVADYIRGRTAYEAQEYAAAGEACERALGRIINEAPFPLLAAYIRNDMGVVYRALGRYEEALAQYKAARAVYAAQGMTVNVAHVDMNMGVVYGSLGRYEEALAQFKAARAVYAAQGMTVDVARVDMNMGNVYSDLGRYEEALAQFKAARAVYAALGMTVDVAEVDVNMGGVYSDLGRYEEALAQYAEALQILDSIPPLPGMRYSYPATRWVIHTNRGIAYEALRRWDEAVSAYQEALDVIESIRGHFRTEEIKLAWGERTKRVYERLIDLLYRLGQGASAFPYTERCRARTFLDLLAQGPLGTLANVAEQGIRAGVVEPEAIQADLDQVIRNLSTHTAVLAYFTTEQAVYLWVITRGTVSDPIRIKVARPVLLGAILSLRKAIETPPERGRELDAFLDVLRQARDLYDLLLGPVAREIVGYTHLVVIPSGPLHYLPFAALYDCPGCEGPALLGGTYQIERTSVSYLPSLTTLKYAEEKRRSATPEPGLFALGDPDSGKPEYRRLPGAQEEVRVVARLFTPPPEPVVVLDREATQAALVHQGTGARHVLLSTHGVFNPVNPMYSYLLVAPGGAEDEKLYTHEVFGLGLRADLVTLSACETLLPSLRDAERQVRAVRGGTEGDPVSLPPALLERITAGDELVGLTRAFIYAGTPTVLASLWSVYDASTRHLMVAFYGRLLAGGRDKAEALRQAQLLLLRDPLYRHPAHWAAFALYGDWR